MGLEFCSFASGSSGNCYLVKSGDTAVLIDAGISTKKIHTCLKDTGIDRDLIRGVFITHEHSDHVKALPVLTKQNPGWQVFATTGTALAIEDKVHHEIQLSSFTAGECLDVGPLRIQSIRISHDAADPVCYSVTDGDSRLLIATDTGYIPSDVQEEMTRADILVLEANHEINMLKAGPYPYHLKRRILGDRGHLSNEAAGMGIAEAMKVDSRFRRVFLAHLSAENNFPELAGQTVKNILEENSIIVGRHLELAVLQRDGISGAVGI